MIRAAKGRVALLNNELQIRSIERGSKDRHKETTGLERKILRWTRWAVLAAVVVPIALALLQDTRISSFLRAKASRLLQPSQSKSPPSARALETATPLSESPTASPTPSMSKSPP